MSRHLNWDCELGCRLRPAFRIRSAIHSSVDRAVSVSLERTEEIILARTAVPTRIEIAPPTIAMIAMPMSTSRTVRPRWAAGGLRATVTRGGGSGHAVALWRGLSVVPD